MAEFSYKDLLYDLVAHRSKFGVVHTKEKTRLLSELYEMKPGGMKELFTLHELLLFFITYPDSAAFLSKTKQLLALLISQLEIISNTNREKFQIAFYESGVIHSDLIWEPSIDACRWLIKLFGEHVTLEWNDSFIEKTGPLLTFFCSRAEQEGLTNDLYDVKDWLLLASGTSADELHSPLKYIINFFEKSTCDPFLKDYIFETLQLKVRLKLNSDTASRTTDMLHPAKAFFQNVPLAKEFDQIKLIRKKINPFKKLSGKHARQIIDLARKVLAVRSRETDPFSYASEVRQVVLERGLSVYLFTMNHERRMPIENYTGFLVLRNGMPIGYGGGWIFIDRCEIGVNIFETFRGGENSYIFTNILRVYCQVFHVKKFAVPPYQFGADNEEGLQSGAFWFYYKLGFRPADETLETIASEEASKIAEDRNYLTSKKALKKFTESPLILNIAKSKYDMEPKHISIVITKWIAKNFKGDPIAATSWSMNRLKKNPAMKSYTEWSKAEKKVFKFLAIFLVLPDVLNSMSQSEVRSLIRLIRLKSENEIAYSLLLKTQDTLLKAWQHLVNEDLSSVPIA